jgi:S-adenosylmethionine hydrolase
MPVVTFLSDYGLADDFVGALAVNRGSAAAALGVGLELLIRPLT